MNENRFASLAAAYGGDIARWPPSERAAAEAWLSTSPQSRALLEAERGLDDLLDAGTVAPSSAELQRRILTTVLATRRGRFSFAGWWPATAGAAGGLTAGLLAGAVAVAVLTPVSAEHGRGFGGLAGYEQSSFGDLDPGDPAPRPAGGAS